MQRFLLYVCCAAGCIPGSAQPVSVHDLTNVSLEDLMNLTVTSVGKKEQRLAKAGAAVFVITQEDVRRSGVTSIPELLRMVPGVDVAHIDANTWAVSIRGFNTRYGNKVLVLIDGRTIYSPVFSGVFWDEQRVPLENIDRIEVIRGPGGSVWGANAVNGVINIITKPANATRGGLITAGGGTVTHGDGLAQYGGKVGRSGAYRAFGRYFRRSSPKAVNGEPATEAGNYSQGGFRMDREMSSRDQLTVQGDFLKAGEGQVLSTLVSTSLPLLKTLSDRISVNSGNLLGRWTRTLAGGSEMTFQSYYDQSRRIEAGTSLNRGTGDLDFQHHVALGARNDLVWGVGYRANWDRFTPGYSFTWTPLDRSVSLFSGFFQDEIKLTPDLSLTVGSKLEHNADSGLEYEPSAQLVWTPTKRQTLWASAARAIRQPSRNDAGLTVDSNTVPTQGGGFALVQITGSPAHQAEEVRDFEAGYRAQPVKRLSLDGATFYSLYRHLATTEPGVPYFTFTPGPPHLVIPFSFQNMGHGHSYGAEVSATWNVTQHWKIAPGYSYLHTALTPDLGSQDVSLRAGQGLSPKHQLQAASQVNLLRSWEWDATLAYTGGLTGGQSAGQKSDPIPGWLRLDSRIGWRKGESFEASVVGQNLLGPRHLEFPSGYQLHTLVERSVFGKITWRF
jgi:iron complex outermembrane receptor protein